MAIRFFEATIAACAAISDAFPFQNQKIVSVANPAAWTGADITFEVEYPSGTFTKVVDRAGALYKLSGVATSTAEYRLMSGDANQAHVVLTGPMNGRIVSTNTGSEANVNQAAARTILVVMDC